VRPLHGCLSNGVNTVSAAETIHVMMCADCRVFRGLHVAAYSLLKHLNPEKHLHLTVFTDHHSLSALRELESTLGGTGKRFDLEFCVLDSGQLKGFPAMRTSLAPYFRLLGLPQLNCSKILYIDIDTLCLLDASELFALELGSSIVAMLPEAELSTCADDTVRLHPDIVGRNGDYFNSGVMLIDVQRWQEQEITDQCISFIASNDPQYWDQSAINVVLQGKVQPFESRFNFITNKREHWNDLKVETEIAGKLLHFLDYFARKRLGNQIH